ncbi:DUF6624 domain-containing protein [Robertkochia aurantiaca]|uniref:DUF6624 domain-containing protein n=1 Tax=Robertkochia aurantiaca TaxID=2873700 RepID=UPI001CCF509D|nr:DUF6624 domain-containing protein [Robertkochia sp. 3YJGBD-33]
MKKMKPLTLLVYLTIVLSAFYGRAQEKDCNRELIEKELIERRDKDQAIRKEVIPMVQEYRKTKKGAFKVIRAVSKMNDIDAENLEYVSNLIDTCGWSDDLSNDANNAIFLILQHSDIEHITKYISLLEEKAQKGLIEKNDHATMLDRKLMYEGKMQVFGTQTFSEGDDSAVNYVWPVADAQNLQKRRDSVLLPPMEDYFKLAKDSMNIEMVWDKTLTLEQALKMKGR